MENQKKVLIVSEEQSFSDTLNEVLQAAGYNAVQVMNFTDLGKIVKSSKYDIYFIDSQLFHSDVFEFVESNNIKGAIVIMSSLDESANTARHDAYFLLKPFKIDDVINIINRIEKVSPVIQSVFIDSFEDSPFFATDNKKLLATLHKASDLAHVSDNVVIYGAFGTGKEFMARFMHDASRRKGRPFIPVNIGWMSPDLIEYELFGKSNFPGVNDKQGVFDIADKGTVYINNFSCMDADMQKRVLAPELGARIIIGLETGPEQLNKEKKLVDEAVTLLENNYIALPELRKRVNDIDRIIELILQDKNISVSDFHIDVSALKLLKKYYWPGNVRELENLVERSILLTNGKGIYIDNLPLKIVKFEEGAIEMNYSLLDVERKHIINTLIRVKGNKAKAARILGIDRKTLYRRIEKLGIEE